MNETFRPRSNFAWAGVSAGHARRLKYFVCGSRGACPKHFARAPQLRAAQVRSHVWWIDGLRSSDLASGEPQCVGWKSYM
jgi:hypothetical protein